MIGMALVAGAILAALVVWSAAGAEQDGSTAGLMALRLIASAGLVALAVQAVRAGAPAAALVAAPIALALLAGPAVGGRRSTRSENAAPPRIESAPRHDERRAA